MKRLDIADFEIQNRSLARHLFEEEERTGEDEGMLVYILFAGTYVTMQNREKTR